MKQQRGGPEGQRCADCKFWDYSSSNQGFCRRKAPSPTVMAKATEYVLVWPSTGLDDWCCEFVKAEDMQAAGTA